MAFPPACPDEPLTLTDRVLLIGLLVLQVGPLLLWLVGMVEPHVR